jgi:mannose-6-phosphate isomerase-like protein (cupin superfamily)
MGFNIKEDFVVLDPRQNATVVKNSPEIYANLDRDFNQFKNHQLVAFHEFDSDWSSWEIHPHGDEVVILLSGSVVFLLDKNNAIEKVHLKEAGDYLVVPRNTWHIAQVEKLAKVLFITPGENTQHQNIK